LFVEFVPFVTLVAFVAFVTEVTLALVVLVVVFVVFVVFVPFVAFVVFVTFEVFEVFAEACLTWINFCGWTNSSLLDRSDSFDLDLNAVVKLIAAIKMRANVMNFWFGLYVMAICTAGMFIPTEFTFLMSTVSTTIGLEPFPVPDCEYAPIVFSLGWVISYIYVMNSWNNKDSYNENFAKHSIIERFIFSGMIAFFIGTGRIKNCWAIFILQDAGTAFLTLVLSEKANKSTAHTK